MNEKLRKILSERTLVIIKPDAVRRALEERILARFKDAGFRIIARKKLFATREQLDGHLPKDPEWIRGMGRKTLASYEESGDNPVETFGSKDPMVIGQEIKRWIYDYLTSGQIIVCVLQGAHAVKTARKLVGNTIPADAAPGTIRGDFSIDSAPSANRAGRACHNVVHASGTLEEAQHEIQNWFLPEELPDE
jgi:nucleoside-diphosphate kinase